MAVLILNLTSRMTAEGEKLEGWEGGQAYKGLNADQLPTEQMLYLSAVTLFEEAMA